MSAKPVSVPLARLIDHTLLKPEATREQIVRLCEEAQQYHFASVCVNPSYVRLCATLLHEADDIAVCTVAGFPLGATLPAVKAFEAGHAIAEGATEIDMVMNVGALKSGDLSLLCDDIESVVQVAHTHSAICKVILETALLSPAEIETACQVAVDVGADFVKTSTGFGPGGATVETIALMRRVVGPEIGVKASGGVRTLADALAMIAAGANRLGASAGVQIVHEALGQTNRRAADSAY